jgi:hypothetical protein
MRESTADRIRDFRADRISRIIGGQAVCKLPDTAKVLLHILPVTVFDPAFSLDLKRISKMHVFQRLPPLFSNMAYNNSRFNLDGIVSFGLEDKSSRVVSYYLQLFRNGAIETVDTYLLSVRKQFIPSWHFEQGIIDVLPKYFSFLADHGIQPPVFVMLSLLGVKGYLMEFGRMPSLLTSQAIDRDNLILSENLIEEFDCDVSKEMRPTLDAVWQASGWECSRNYDETGQRVPPRQ